MNEILIECLFVFVLVLANGLFALAEIAIVSVRKARLKQRAEGGDASAAAALKLAESPEDFLSTVQIGITLVGILAGVFGGANIAEKLAVYLKQVDALAPYAQALSMTFVVAVITYLSLVLGELVPKRVGLNYAERIACFVSRPMAALARFAAPVVAILTASGNAVLWLLRIKPSSESPVTEEEVNIMIKEGTKAGVFEKHESEFVERVFKFTDQTAASVMTRRSDMVWLDTKDDEAINRKKIHDAPHSYFPVATGRLSNFHGLASVKKLWAAGSLDLKNNLLQPVFVPASMPASELLNVFRSSRVRAVMVVDEFGAIIGLTTISDILSVIVGDIEPPAVDDSPDLVQRPDGSWLLDGMVPIERLREHFKLNDLPGEDRATFTTLGGFLMMNLGRIPRVADRFDWNGYRFEIVDMDGRRVDKVLLIPPGVERVSSRMPKV